MPVGDNGQYIAPTFVNNNAPALDADEMNGMAGAAEGAVEYDREQFLSATQKTRGRLNISAAAQADVTALQQTVQQLGSQFTFKGATTSALLPQVGNVVNDTYFVTDLGYNETWNGTEWKQSGSPITVDSNLETAGYAADAQKTGNAIADQYSTTSSYDIGDIVLHSGTLYKCITAIPVAEAWNDAHWQTVNIGGVANELNASLDGKLGVSDYSAAAAVGTADNLIDRKATATEQEWLGLRTSCGDVSISDDGTARIDAIYGNTVDGVNMTVNAIETVGFNLFDKDAYTGETETYGGLTCVKVSGAETGTKLIDDGAYLGLGQIEYSAYIHRGTYYYPQILVEYTDGTQETISYYKVEGGGASAWGTYYFLTNAEKTVSSISSRHSGSTISYPEFIALDTICIHYVWSGYRNGEFEEYWKRVLELPISTYFPNGMMSTATVRDELRTDKAIQRCELSGGVVVALAEPVEIPIDPPLNLVYKVSDFGTENAKSSVTSAPFIADIAYNSDFTRMIVNNSDHIGTLSNLQTTAKNNLVAAINEVAYKPVMTKLVDVTLTETAAINITHDDDGNALNIKEKLLMFVLLPKDSEVKQPAFLVLYKYQNAEVGRLYSSEVPVSTLAGNKPGAFGMCENFGGIWRGCYSSSVANIDGASGSLVGYGTSQMYSVEGHPITSLSTTQELLAGTQIIVWGC